MTHSVPETIPASWPAFVIGAALALLIWGLVYAGKIVRKLKCRHLHPELVASDLTLWRCTDCGHVTVEGATLHTEGGTVPPSREGKKC